MAEGKKHVGKMSSEIIQAIVIDTINIYTREVLRDRKLLNKEFDKFFDEELDVVKYNLAERISAIYKNTEIDDNV